ncbi:MAG: glutamine synthetase beta-grasp domain-containing protein [Planctomycetes bacterium]|nr:glutamine synthetase beta-grasp domain-containing protein [Planctomycetota bacterium]
MTHSTELVPSSTVAPADPQAPLPACRLVRLIGRPPSEWTVDDLVEVVVSFHVRLVSLMHIGGDGWLKTLDFVPRDVSHLREVLSFGERADGSSLFGPMGVSVTASDVVLRPRLSTAFVDPLAAHPTLVVLCAHHGRDGLPLAESPDTLLHLAYQRLETETGVELHGLGEIEFFLGKRPDESDIYGAAERGYHASSPFVFGEGLRRKALVLLSEIGVPVKYGHGEVGYIQADEIDERIWEQHEIELGLQPLPAAADSVVITQWLLRNLAQQGGLRCSFEPILRKGHAGSGMHFHFSPVIAGVHQPTHAADGELRDVAKWLIGGLVRYANGLMAFGNRSQSSFVRLAQAKEAPNTITWGRYNRKALIRLPIVAQDKDGRSVSPETIEFRLPDGTAHPHLLLAAIAQVMTAGRSLEHLDALIEKTSAQTLHSPYAIAVPRSFAEVGEGLRQQREVLEAGGVFPRHVIDRVLEALGHQ